MLFYYLLNNNVIRYKALGAGMVASVRGHVISVALILVILFSFAYFFFNRRTEDTNRINTWGNDTKLFRLQMPAVYNIFKYTSE